MTDDIEFSFENKHIAPDLTDGKDPQQIHTLLVKPWDTTVEPVELFEITHPDCPRYLEGDEYACQVAFEIENVGLETFFRHIDDPERDWAREERLTPGEYQIEGWSETYSGPEGFEYDSGLRLADAPEAQS